MTIRLLIPVGLVVLDIILNVLGTIICVHFGSVQTTIRSESKKVKHEQAHSLVKSHKLKREYGVAVSIVLYDFTETSHVIKNVHVDTTKHTNRYQ